MEGVSNDITFFARTNWRGEGKVFGIRQADRRHHMYVIGKTGTGKTTMLKTMIRQDIEAGRGVAVFDPHGDMVEELAASIPDERQDDLLYFNVPDPNLTLGHNPLANVPRTKRSLAASGVLEVFKKMWADSWGPRLEHLLRNALLALVELPDSTLEDVLKLLENPIYRRRIVERVANSRVRDVWLREFEGYPQRLRGEAIAPIQNKVGAKAAFFITRNWGLEGAASVSESAISSNSFTGDALADVAGETVRVGEGRLNLAFRTALTQQVDLVISAGPQYTVFDGPEPFSGKNWGLNAGGGFIVRVSENWAVMGDARYVASNCDWADWKSTNQTDNAQATVAIAWAPPRRERPKPVVRDTVYYEPPPLPTEPVCVPDRVYLADRFEYKGIQFLQYSTPIWLPEDDVSYVFTLPDGHQVFRRLTAAMDEELYVQPCSGTSSYQPYRAEPAVRGTTG